MENFIPESLKQLALILDAPVYIVGGAVRDFLLGKEISDFDISGALKPQEIFKRLENTKYHAIIISKTLGTVQIRAGSKEAFEYTTFRADNYSMTGKHKPEDVVFVQDIELDAKRRDFTINAIYYDIVKREFVDPLKGMIDLKHMVLKTCQEPSQTFKEDALRMLRLVRQSAELDFSIDEDTFTVARDNIKSLKAISVERVQIEFTKIILADGRHNKENAHVKGIKLLDEIGALNIIVPELVKTKGIKQKKKYHKYDVYLHTLEVFRISERGVVERLTALLHDIGKVQFDNQASMKGHDVLSAKYAETILRRLKYPNKVTKSVVAIIKNHMFDTKGEETNESRMSFIQDNHTIIDQIILFKKVDKIASGLTEPDLSSYYRMQTTLEYMKNNNIPFKLKDLPVKGTDILDAGIQKEKIGTILTALLKANLTDHALQSKECAMEFILNISNQI